MSEQENLILRAWDKKSRKMREVDSIAFHNSRSVCDYCSSRLPKVVNLWGFNIITQQDVVIYREIKDVELMRYTGKNDKCGVKIFDGDIVKLSSGAIGFIVCEHEYQAYIIRFSKKDKFYQCGLGAYQSKELEIIGNIYENKEVISA